MTACTSHSKGDDVRYSYFRSALAHDCECCSTSRIILGSSCAVESRDPSDPTLSIVREMAFSLNSVVHRVLDDVKFDERRPFVKFSRRHRRLVKKTRFPRSGGYQPEIDTMALYSEPGHRHTVGRIASEIDSLIS